MRRIQCSINPQPPVLRAIRHYRKLEIESLPICIQDKMQPQPFTLQIHTHGEAVRERRPIRRLSFTPCQACFTSRGTWPRLTRRRSCSTSRITRSSISNFTNRRTSACWDSRFQSNQLVSLSRSEEHTSELQSRENLVCRLLLEKK